MADEVRGRLTWLRTHLFFGSALLTLGVADIGFLGQWMALYFSDPAVRASVQHATQAITLGVGTVCSVVLACGYIPPALRLRAIATQLAAGDTEKQKRDWLDENGFGLTPLEQVLRVATTLIPTVLGSQVPAWVSALTQK